MMDSILNFFITTAHADAPAAAAQQGQQAGGSFLFIMLPLFVVFFYLTVWRPQTKRAKEQRNLMGSIAKGDEVMTAGGIVGKVTKLTDQYVGLTVASNVELLLQKSSVVTILPKGTIKSIE